MNFTLNKNNLDGLVGKLKELDQDKLWSVTVKPYKTTRSLDANAYYWNLVAELAEKQIKNLKVMTIGSTTKLNAADFNKYLESVKDFARGYGFKLGEEEIKD
mgnify:CR=1 FL=1